jgi:hypothetical protein
VLVAASFVAPISRAATPQPAVSGQVGTIGVQSAYAVRSGPRDAVAFFTLSNRGASPDVLLNAMSGGLPVIGVWHQHVAVTADQLADLAGCGSGQAPLDAAVLHWMALVVPAHGSVAIVPGQGQLEVRVPLGARTVAVTFAFDRNGPLAMSLPIRDGRSPVPFRQPA